MSRKAYKTTELQAEANKRYYQNNIDAKHKRKIRNCKSNGKRFILEFSTIEDLELYEEYIKIRKQQLNQEKQA